MADFVVTRHYKSVSASSSDTNEYVIPNGRTLSLVEFGGNAAASPDTSVTVKYWDGSTHTIVFATHGDDSQIAVNLDYVGNGTRSIKIVLTNDQAQDDYLGAWWTGNLI